LNAEPSGFPIADGRLPAMPAQLSGKMDSQS
jgi:hypothetical protein